MANRKIEDYAFKFGISNKEAKRRLGKGGRNPEGYVLRPDRGAPVPGTGKPKGATK